MDSELHEFLRGRHPLSHQTADWGTSDAPYPVELRWYACDSPAPERFVVSIRAVVFRDDEVLVIADKGGGRFIVPGGHRMARETFEETVVREVLEECGWRIRPIRIFAGLHIHACGAPRAGILTRTRCISRTSRAQWKGRRSGPETTIGSSTAPSFPWTRPSGWSWTTASMSSCVLREPGWRPPTKHAAPPNRRRDVKMPGCDPHSLT